VCSNALALALNDAMTFAGGGGHGGVSNQEEMVVVMGWHQYMSLITADHKDL